MSNKKELLIPPSILTKGTGKYSVTWDGSLNITAEISRIKDDSHCEIMVIHGNGNGKELLLQPTATNLTSSRDLSGIASRLSRVTPQISKDNWDTMLGDVSYKVIWALREGEPVIMLNDENYGKLKPEFILPPFFIKNAPNIIYADRGNAKTTFIILIDLALSLPWFANPLSLLITHTKHKILFLDWENTEQIIGWQKACLRRGMGVDDFPIAYRHCKRPLADDLPQIQEKIDEVGADVIIIDSLGMAVGDDLNLTKPAFSFYGALRQLPGVTPFILAHTAKNNDKKTVYGNAFYENEARNIWEAVKQQEPNSKELILILHHRKPAPFQGMHDPIAFKFTFQDNKTLVEKADAPEEKKQSMKQSNTETVFAILSEADPEPLEPKEISEKTDPKISANSVYKALYDLKEKGKVDSSEGKYFIVKAAKK